MKKNALRSILVVGIIVPAFIGAQIAGFFSEPVKAANAALFNPSRIIDDAIFTNNTSMTADQIQSFLNAKNSTCLKNFTTLSLTDDNGDGRVQETGSEPYGKHGNMSAAQLIKAAADIYKINPQVILVTLEKEQGLVTRSDCPSWRYNTALGYGCPDSQPVCNQAAYGFTRQIDYGVYHFRGFFDDSLNTVPFGVGNYRISYNPQASCGSSVVNIQNRATAALYSYTPYQPNSAAIAANYGAAPPCGAYGNRNFWLYFNDWFGNSTGTLLLQSPASSTVYLQSGNTRFSISSWDVLDAYGFKNEKVTPVSDTYISSLTDGGLLTTTFTRQNDGAVYLADNGFKFAFSSYQQCVDWGFSNCTNPAYTKSLDQVLFDRLHTYGALRPLLLNGSSVSQMVSGEKRTFLSTAAMNENGYSSSDITPITNPLNIRQPHTYSVPQNNSFVSFSGNPTIYAFSNNRFYTLPSYDLFTSLQSASTPVLVDSFSRYTTSPPASTSTLGPILTSTNGATYLLNGGAKYDITQVKNEWPQAQSAEVQGILDKKPLKSAFTSSTTYRTPDGSIFKVEAGNLRPFYSLNDYFALGNSEPANLNGSVSALLGRGAYVLQPGGGSLFKVTNPGEENAIYTLSASNELCRIESMAQLGAFGFNSASVNRIDKPNLNTKILSSWITGSNGSNFIIDNGLKVTTSAAALSTDWGITPGTSCIFTDDFIKKIPGQQRTLGKFVQDANGTIYYAQSGQKRLITSYQKFLNLGGNGSNTYRVPQAFIDASPSGSPV